MRAALAVGALAMSVGGYCGSAASAASVASVASVASGTSVTPSTLSPTVSAIAATGSSDAMEALYREGMLPSGAPLVGRRPAGATLKGADAACMNCHRRSGFGTAEGQIVIPPVAGTYLFRPAASRNDDMDFRYMPGYVNLKREPYTPATLAAAIRTGIGRDGRPLRALMPRFDLDDDTMARLTGYLRGLSATRSPGVTDSTIHFATIVTPDADPAARDGMLAVLRQFFADQNEFIRGGAKPMRSEHQVPYRVTRRWQLHVWTLHGEPGTWERQLRAKLAAEPVFAVISGIAGATWAPVHRFCESAALPCLFPNAAVPVVAEGDYYDVYFSKGVLLESDLIGTRVGAVAESGPALGRPSAANAGMGVNGGAGASAGADAGAGAGARADARAGAPQRVVQVFQQGDVGQDGARRLAADLAALDPRPSVDRVLDGTPTAATLAHALGAVRAGDTLVLWLRPAALALLPPAPPPGATVYVSGLMGGLEAAPLPRAWRASALLTYPVALPLQRRIAMNFPLAWFKVRHVPVTDERVQTDTYLACQILSEAVSKLLDLFQRDYLVEELEDMLSRRLVNGYFPRLSLAPRQRFASKGGYLVKLSGDPLHAVSAQGGWIVP